MNHYLTVYNLSEADSRPKEYNCGIDSYVPIKILEVLGCRTTIDRINNWKREREEIWTDRCPKELGGYYGKDGFISEIVYTNIKNPSISYKFVHTLK